MNETEFAVLSERVQQFRLNCESIESRLQRIEAVQVSMDKSVALYEVGLQGTKEWIKQLDTDTQKLKELQIVSTRFWLSFLMAGGALIVSIITLLIKIVGG